MPWISRDATGAINGVYAVRQPGLTEELSDDDPVVGAFRSPKTLDPADNWDLVSLRIAFNHENRIRVLEGKPQVSLVQFKTFIKSQL